MLRGRGRSGQLLRNTGRNGQGAGVGVGMLRGAGIPLLDNDKVLVFCFLVSRILGLLVLLLSCFLAFLVCGFLVSCFLGFLESRCLCFLV